jgi:hypothetical protein
MTAPIRFPRGRFTDNDEVGRTKARNVQKLGKSYEEGSAYSDIDETSTTAEKLNAAKDYDMLSRIRKPRVSYPLPTKPKVK